MIKEVLIQDSDLKDAKVEDVATVYEGSLFDVALEDSQKKAKNAEDIENNSKLIQ